MNNVQACHLPLYDQYELERQQAAIELERLSDQLDRSVDIQNRRVRDAVQEATSDLPAALARLDRMDSSLAGLAGQRTEVPTTWPAAFTTHSARRWTAT